MSRDQRIPPHNIGAEEAIIGALMLSPRAVDELAEFNLQVSDFYKPAHQFIYSAIHDLVSSDRPVDVIAVGQELRHAGQIDMVGGDLALMEILHGNYLTSNVLRYARIVADGAILRRMISTASEIADIAYDAPNDVNGALEDARSKVNELSATGGVLADMTGYHDSMGEMNAPPPGAWVAQNLVCAGEVMTVTSGGGLGKSSWGRSIAYAVENGLHPWFGRPAECGSGRSLVVDLETQPWNIQESSGWLVNKTAGLLDIDYDDVRHPAILQRRGRLDLRSRPDRATIREALRRANPDFVVMGPLKNLYIEDGNESYARAALETQDILMQLMTDFHFGLYVEAHGSKGAKTSTAGSQRWDDWPDMAIGLEKADEDAPPSRDHGYNNALTEFCNRRKEGEMALQVTRNREPRNSGMVIPKLLIRSPHRFWPFTLAA